MGLDDGRSIRRFKKAGEDHSGNNPCNQKTMIDPNRVKETQGQNSPYQDKEQTGRPMCLEKAPL